MYKRQVTDSLTPEVTARLDEMLNEANFGGFEDGADDTFDGNFYANTDSSNFAEKASAENGYAGETSGRGNDAIDVYKRQARDAAAGKERLAEQTGVLADANKALMTQAERFAEAGKTPLLFMEDGKLLGIIAVADTIKEDSAAAIRDLRNLGLRVVMLTGDNEKTAAAILLSLIHI